MFFYIYSSIVINLSETDAFEHCLSINFESDS